MYSCCALLGCFASVSLGWPLSTDVNSEAGAGIAGRYDNQSARPAVELTELDTLLSQMQIGSPLHKRACCRGPESSLRKRTLCLWTCVCIDQFEVVSKGSCIPKCINKWAVVAGQSWIVIPLCFGDCGLTQFPARFIMSQSFRIVSHCLLTPVMSPRDRGM